MNRKFVLLAFLSSFFVVLQAQTKNVDVPYSPAQIQNLLHDNEHSAPTTTALPRAGEDWSTIYLSQSGLPTHALGGVTLSKVEVDGCSREIIRLEWRPNDPINLYVIRPQGIAKPPVILFLYNYNIESTIFQRAGWCAQVKRNGFAVAGFASALSLERIRPPRPLREWFVSQMQESLACSTHDVEMTLNYLDSRGDLDISHIEMFGEGSGGAIAILAAAADARIAALQLVDPWGDWHDWLLGSKQIPENERAAYLAPEFLSRIANLDPIVYLPRLRIPIRIEQLNTDTVTPNASKQKIAMAARDPKNVIFYSDVAERAKTWGASGGFDWLSSQLTVAHASGNSASLAKSNPKDEP